MTPRNSVDMRAILDAATEIADSNGMEEVTLASVAKKLGIRSPSLYNHVDGLDGLRRQLALHGLEKLHHALMNAVVGRAGDDAVRALGKAYVEFARSNTGLYQATLRAPDVEDPRLKQAGDNIVHLTMRVLEGFGLKDEEALHVVRGLRSLFHGFASIEQSGGFGLPLDLDESLSRLIDTYIAGIHAMYDCK